MMRCSPASLVVGFLFVCCPFAARADLSLDSAKNLLAASEAAVFIPARVAYFADAVDPSSSLKATGAYSATGWTLTETGTYLGQSLTVNMTGSFNAATNTMAFSGNGFYGASPWLTTGQATFSGANSEFFNYQENGEIGAHSWHWWAVGGELLVGVGAGIVGTPATGLAVGSGLLSLSGVAITIDVANNPPPPVTPPPPTPPTTPPTQPIKPPTGPNGGEVICIQNVNTGGGPINITKNVQAPQKDGASTVIPNSAVLVTGAGAYAVTTPTSGTFDITFTTQAVPEPSPALMGALGVALFAAARWFHRPA